MESLSSAARWQTWATRNQQWSNLEEVETHCSSSESLAAATDDDDDVFADGNTELYLQNRGSKPCSQNASLWSLDSTLNSGDATFQMRLAMHAASNEMVPELLQSRWEDAEEILWQLGFGHDVQELTVRIPLRFLSSPSQARGINFRLFLDSQVRRIREEDPSFCIASRFRQVQALTAMANAFCSLYSHVSRTPLRKLGAPKFTFTVSSAPASARNDGKSRVGRLKDAVSHMCLYASTGERSRLPDSTGTLDSGDGRPTQVASRAVLESPPEPIHSGLTEDGSKPLATAANELIDPVFSKMGSKDLDFGGQNQFPQSVLGQTYPSEDCYDPDGFEYGENCKTFNLEEVYSTVEKNDRKWDTNETTQRGDLANSTQSDSSGFTDEDI